MDTSVVYSKTGKGLVALKTGAASLSALQAQVLEMVDGQADIAALGIRLGAAAGQLPHILSTLERLELIHAYADEAADAAMPADGRARDAAPAIEVVELSPTASVQAWAEAQRGARELREHGFYSPPANLLHVRLEPGSGINRILIVEDDATTARVLEFLLKERNFQVATACDGATAWSELGKRPLPDAVLLDVMLPGQDGFALLRQIRSEPALASLPVIMVTARVSDEDVMRGLKEGADGYVFKPVKWETLYACIKNVL